MLATIVGGGQGLIRPAGDVVRGTAAESLDRLDAAIGTGDGAGAEQAIDELQEVDGADPAVGARRLDD